MPARRGFVAFVAVVALMMAGVAHAGGARDFTAEVQALYRVAACGGDAGAPAEYDAKTVAAHCKQVRKSIGTWNKKWFAKASPFFAELFKGGYPSSVVYPFGGGDLLTALAVYPNATEYTLLSLEGMGDPRPILALAAAAVPTTTDGKADKAAQKAAQKVAKQLKTRLAKVTPILSAQLGWAWNTTIQLSKDSVESGTGALPVLLVMTLVALEANGYEPVGARYFTLDASGGIVYLDDAAVADADAHADEIAKANAKKQSNENLVMIGPFNNVEITFRKKGDAKAPLKTFRHIAADLSDKGLTREGAALAYLGKQGKVAAMTKAASYLLWYEGFAKIRDFLLAHMQLMVSDDTGIPPRYADPAGFAQVTWGKYDGAYFGNGGGPAVQKEMIKLWKATSKGALPFRFGYYDDNGHANLLYTTKK